jgi:uncharacterized protein YqjF (DUF2071 family)
MQPPNTASRPAVELPGSLSRAARGRILSQKFEPLFLAAWESVLMIHFEVESQSLQRIVPFELDLLDGRAFVSLVAFTMRAMRPRFGGRLTSRLLRPIATHHFLNVRTYVRHDGETGIHFLAEWLSSALAAKLGPATFSLPYRHGQIRYAVDSVDGNLRGDVVDARSGTTLTYRGTLPIPTELHPCETGSSDEWLMERYTAFNSAGGRKRFFRVWHPPWLQCSARVEAGEISLLTRNWSWFADAIPVSANYSPGFREVWMGWPHRTL